MKKEQHNYLLFSSSTEQKSRYAVAREVKIAMARNEKASNLLYTPLQKRRIIRHEVLHHLPLEQDEMSVEAGVRTEHDGHMMSTYGWVAVCHPLTKNIRYLVSLFTPLLDRRFKQKLSGGDIDGIKNYFRQFIHSKNR